MGGDLRNSVYVLPPAQGGRVRVGRLPQVTSVSLLFPFLIDGAKSSGLVGTLKLLHLESAFLLIVPGPELRLAVLFTLTLRCVSKLWVMVLLLFGSPCRWGLQAFPPVSCPHRRP